MPLSKIDVGDQQITPKMLSFDIGQSAALAGAASTGSQGVQGVQGIQGVQGVQGIQGVQGTQGTQGVQGVQGTPGFLGADGNQGNQGNQGSSGTIGVDGNQGNQGTQGVQGVQGVQGTQGVQGNQGNTGPQGNQGNQGNQGSTGSGNQGNQGNQGSTGPQGNQGNQGNTGSGNQGNQGNQGPTGSAALTNYQVAYGTGGGITSSPSIKIDNGSGSDALYIGDIAANLNGEAFLDTYTASTSTAAVPLSIRAKSSGTPAPGFGSEILLSATASGNSSQTSQVRMISTWLNATNATLESQLDVHTMHKTIDAANSLSTLTLSADESSVKHYTTSTSAYTAVLGLYKRSTGSPTTGFGSGLSLYADTATVDDRFQGQLSTRWSDPADVTRTSYFQLELTQAATSTNVLTIGHNTSPSNIVWFKAQPTNSGIGLLTASTNGFLMAGALAPDSGTGGGNTRGAGSVDLQLHTRTAASQVAAGPRSGLFAGYSNTISTTSDESVILGGFGNTISAGAIQSAVLAGYNHTVTGDSAAIIGGTACTANGVNSAILSGQDNVTDHVNSVTMGISGKSMVNNSFNMSSGHFANVGDARVSTFVARVETTNATATNMTIDGTAFYTLQPDSMIVIEAIIVANNTGDTMGAGYKRYGAYQRPGTGNAALVGAVATTFTAEETAAMNATFVVDTTSVRLQVTGIAATTIRWVALVTITEIQY